jgi:DNA-binding NtrC family response regulator
MSEFEEQLKEIEDEISTGKTDLVIIDDDYSFTLMLKDYLSAHFRSEVFRNGEDFLKQYKSHDKRKIVLDYDFGNGLDGLAILKKIKDINPNAIIIMVSSKDDLETALKTLRSGASDYFLKTNKTVFANILCSLMKFFKMEKHLLN